MVSNKLAYYEYVSEQVNRCDNISVDYKLFLFKLLHQANQQDRYSKPMPWIGMYIALASLFCILAMSADLLHGIRNRKLWFPCKYFTLNAASLTVIAVAIKLPMDLNNSMLGYVDQAAKLGSMALMCTMMANLLPSLAAMDSKELLTNITALSILVVTLVVNICIQIKTGVVSSAGLNYRFVPTYTGLVANTYVAMLLILLMIHICTALTILKSKKILESKYQAGHETTLIEMQQAGRVLSVEELKKHVTNHWIMAGTGSPQFVTVCSATTSASGVICVLSTILHTVVFLYTCQYTEEHDSDYKWSMLVILIIQFIGVVLGTISPLCRCFAALSFKLSVKWIRNHIKVFKVESYWTQKLCDWKQSSIPFSISSRKSKIVIHNFKILFLCICIGFQKIVVVACKMIAMIPVFFVICVFYCKRCHKWINAMFSVLDIVLVENSEHQETNNDQRRYVLQLQDNMEIAERTLKGITKSLNRLILRAEKQQPNKLINLVEGSVNFEGVGQYDSHLVPNLSTKVYLDCWSLALLTLSTLATSLPNIQKNIVDRLLSGVYEGLKYVTLVEENLNAIDEHVSIRKASDLLWFEVEVDHKWLGNKLQNIAHVNSVGQILQWFKDTSKNKVIEMESTDFGSPNDNSIYTSICANSMYRITETILLSYNTDIEEVSQEELFSKLSSMISDILAACLTNLPQVIAMKCHESAIEKREASVHLAAQLLGETTRLINNLQDRELPSLNPNELPFIDSWRTYLNHPSP